MQSTGGSAAVVTNIIDRIEDRVISIRCDGIMARLRGDNREAIHCRAMADFLDGRILTREA